MINQIYSGYNLLITIAVFGALVIRFPSQPLIYLSILPLPLYFAKNLFRTFTVKAVAQRPNYYPTELTNQISKNPIVGEIIQSHRNQPLTVIINNNPPPQSPSAINPEVLTSSQVKDLDRRMFLKLIGSAGITAFLFSIFTDKSHAAFFGSMPGPGTIAIKDSNGTVIDPSEKQPTDGYNISQVDDGITASYYGFVHRTGAWYIQKEDATGNYRYTKGPSDFATNWTNRTSLTYDYFDNIF